MKEGNIMKKLLILFMTLLLTFALVACGGSEEPAADDATTPAEGDEAATAEGYGSEINIGMDVDPQTYVPILWNNTTANRVGMLIYEGLTYNDENLKPQPLLATEWETPDETTWIFTLREGVKFHDGSDFTAADVKYTYDAILDENNNAVYRSRYTSIESVEVIDDYTVQFNLNQPFAAILAYTDMGIMPEGALDIPDFSTAPIGTGPYVLEEYSLNTVTKLVANEQHWEAVPPTPMINVHVINDNSVRIAALQAGDVDFISSPLTATDLPVIANNPDISYHKTAAPGITYLGFSVTHPVLSDLAVRQAIAHLVNKETIAANFYSDMDTPGQTPVQYTSWAWDESLQGYPYDAEEAAAILDAAGWVDSDGDGIRDKDGQALAFTLSTHTDDSSRFQVVEYMQNQMTNIGMDVDISVTEWALFSADMVAQKTEVWVAGWLNFLDPDRMYDMFHSQSGSNYGGFNNARVDELLELGRATSDQAARAEAYQEVAQLVTDEVYYVTMLDQAYICAYNSKIENYTVNPSGSIFAMRYAQIAE